MALFDFIKQKPAAAPASPKPTSQIPITQVDLSKRYDVYCTVANESRLYENVRFLGDVECFPWSTKGAQTKKPRAERSAALGSGTGSTKSPARVQQGAAKRLLRPCRALTTA